MTEPRDTQREPQAKAAAERGPEDKPEAIEDLDVKGDDVDHVAVGGGNYLEIKLDQVLISGS
jgi:hypothetical protein